MSLPITAFVVRVPEAEALVQTLRLRFDASASQGAPAHITLLVPWRTMQAWGLDQRMAPHDAH